MLVDIWAQSGLAYMPSRLAGTINRGEIDVCVIYTSDNSCTHFESIV